LPPSPTRAAADEGLAIDGKTMRKAIDAEGRQAHILAVVGHRSQTWHTAKKSGPCP
jgi:predicted transposase YbfD/YdcC